MESDEETSSHFAYARLSAGLKQGPRPCPWDFDTKLYGCSQEAEFGVVDGWLWGTDRATAVIERAPEETPDDERRQERGRKVVEIASYEPPGPRYSLMVKHAALMGGMVSTQVGKIDLSRLADAVFWVAQTEEDHHEASGDDTVTIGVDPDFRGIGGPLFRVTNKGRMAAIIGLTWGPTHGWHPECELPLKVISDD